MTCVYERHRSKEELKAMLGYMPLPQGEVYLEEDPPRMFAAMRRTDKPCLAFKILAAGRLSDSEIGGRGVPRTFRQIKPTDAVIVGMYPEYEDQPAQNAQWVREFSGSSAGTDALQSVSTEATGSRQRVLRVSRISVYPTGTW